MFHPLNVSFADISAAAIIGSGRPSASSLA
jgi:hypothetical protein